MVLIMLILIGTVKTAYALNRTVTARQSQDFVAIYNKRLTLLRVRAKLVRIGDRHEDVTEYVRTKEFKPSTMLALQMMVNGIGTNGTVQGILQFRKLSTELPKRHVPS